MNHPSQLAYELAARAAYNGLGFVHRSVLAEFAQSCIDSATKEAVKQLKEFNDAWVTQREGYRTTIDHLERQLAAARKGMPA